VSVRKRLGPENKVGKKTGKTMPGKKGFLILSVFLSRAAPSGLRGKKGRYRKKKKRKKHLRESSNREGEKRGS